MDILKLSDVTIDFDAMKLIFDSALPRTYQPGGDPLTACLVIELQVQDRPVHLLVDTGTPGIILYEERVRRRVPGLRTSGSIKNATMGARLPIKQATLPDVAFGKRNRDAAIIFLPSPAPDKLVGIDGIVGIAELQAHRVHFDFSGKMLSWE